MKHKEHGACGRDTFAGYAGRATEIGIDLHRNGYCTIATLITAVALVEATSIMIGGAARQQLVNGGMPVSLANALSTQMVSAVVNEAREGILDFHTSDIKEKGGPTGTVLDALIADAVASNSNSKPKHKDGEVDLEGMLEQLFGKRKDT